MVGSGIAEGSRSGGRAAVMAQRTRRMLHAAVVCAAVALVLAFTAQIASADGLGPAASTATAATTAVAGTAESATKTASTVAQSSGTAASSAATAPKPP